MKIQNHEFKEKEGDKLEDKIQEMFTRHTKTADLMRQVNEEIVQMSPAEFAIYINAVEIPHTEILKTKKSKYEKEGNENEKN